MSQDKQLGLGKAIRWNIRLLGGISLENVLLGRVTEALPTRAVTTLFAALALEPGKVWQREELAARAWPRGDSRAALRNGLSLLRKTLEPENSQAGTVLVADRNHVWLRAETVFVDAVAFQQAVQSATRFRDIPLYLERCHEAINLYTGPLLGGKSGSAPWVDNRALDLQNSHSYLVHRLISLYEEMDEPEKALQVAQQAFSAHPEDARYRAHLYRLSERVGRALASLPIFAHLLETEENPQQRALLLRQAAASDSGSSLRVEEIPALTEWLGQTIAVLAPSERRFLELLTAVAVGPISADLAASVLREPLLNLDANQVQPLMERLWQLGLLQKLPLGHGSSPLYIAPDFLQTAFRDRCSTETKSRLRRRLVAWYRIRSPEAPTPGNAHLPALLEETAAALLTTGTRRDSCLVVQLLSRVGPQWLPLEAWTRFARRLLALPESVAPPRRMLAEFGRLAADHLIAERQLTAGRELLEEVTRLLRPPLPLPTFLTSPDRSLAVATGRSLALLAWALWQQGEDDDGARTRLEESLALARASQDQEGTAYCHRRLGDIYAVTGRSQAALAAYRAAFERYQGLSNAAGGQAHGFEVADIRVELGSLLRRLGRFSEARGHLAAALDWAQSREDRTLEGRVLLPLALLVGDLGFYPEARMYLERALSGISPENRRVSGQWAATMGTVGEIALKQFRLEEARRYLDAGLAFWQPQEHVRWIAFFQVRLALWALYRGEREAALRLATEVAAVCPRPRSGITWAMARYIQGRATDDPEQAEALLEEAMAFRRAFGDRLGALIVSEARAETLLNRGRRLEAAALLESAATERKALGTPPSPAEESYLQTLHRRILESPKDQV